MNTEFEAHRSDFPEKNRTEPKPSGVIVKGGRRKLPSNKIVGFWTVYL
jgi:hypothetical protein